MVPEKGLKAGDQLTLNLLLQSNWDITFFFSFFHKASDNELLSPSSWAWSTPGRSTRAGVLGVLLYQEHGCLLHTVWGCGSTNGICPVFSTDMAWLQPEEGRCMHMFCVSSG